jgi:predicted dienelactone hydrolase
MPFRAIIHILAAVAMTIGPAFADATPPVGIRAMVIAAPERGGSIAIGLWYPAASGGALESIGGSRVFQGVAARRNAPMAAGRFPLVLLGHGGLRSAPNLGNWLAADLAARGYLVAVVQAPAIAEDAEAALRETWLRPIDLVAALNAVIRDPILRTNIDASRIGAIGFLRGGTSVLQLAGARLEPSRFAELCDAIEPGPDCRWFAKLGLDLHRADLAPIGRSLHDIRIRGVVAIDPELADRFAPESLAAIGRPVSIIALGQAGLRLTGLGAAALQEMIPGESLTLLADATPFSAFGLCTAQAPALLEDEDEPICSETPAHRRAMHDVLARLIDQALGRAFAAP